MTEESFLQGTKHYRLVGTFEINLSLYIYEDNGLLYLFFMIDPLDLGKSNTTFILYYTYIANFVKIRS